MTKTTTEKKVTFTDLLRDFEEKTINRSPKTEEDYTYSLYNLSTAIAYSILNKCIDPQRNNKTEKVSNSGYNKTLVKLKQDLYFDSKNIFSLLERCKERSFDFKITKNGDIKIEKNKEINNNITSLLEHTISDSQDLVDDIIVALLQEVEKTKERNSGILPPCFLEDTYNVKRLKRKVWIKEKDSVLGWEEVATTPITEVNKSGRRCIENNRSVQIDVNNQYSYIEDTILNTDEDTEEDIYIRIPKNMNIGSYIQDFNGKATNYTVDTQSYKDINTIIEKMNLTKRQAKILQLRLSGKGYKSIATYMGIKPESVRSQLKCIQKKLVDFGYKKPIEKKSEVIILPPQKNILQRSYTLVDAVCLARQQAVAKKFRDNKEV